jgi:hypothetical protein
MPGEKKQLAFDNFRWVYFSTKSPNHPHHRRKTEKQKSKKLAHRKQDPTLDQDAGHALFDLSWVNVMHEQLENFERNHVWTLVDPPRDVNVIGTKRSFKNKQGEDGEIVRNKACLIAQGFSQVEGLDFGETFVPVAHLEAIRILLAFAVSKGFKLYQIDMKNDFLNSVIQEEVYVRQLQVLRILNTQIVYTLSKALYRLK